MIIFFPNIFGGHRVASPLKQNQIKKWKKKSVSFNLAHNTDVLEHNVYFGGGPWWNLTCLGFGLFVEMVE
jgi:hypothetical protein